MSTLYGQNLGSPFAIVDTDGRLHVEALLSGTPTLTISGNIIIGSVTANVDSIYVQSGANITGSAYCYQVTDPWITSGTSTIAGSVYAVGSLNIATNLQDIGSFTAMSLGSFAVTNIGSILHAGPGSVIQATDPWIISGNVLVSGIVNLGSAWGGTGSVYTVNSSPTGSEMWVKGGSILTYDPKGIGSVLITNDVLPISGIVGMGLGSMYSFDAIPTLVSQNPLYRYEYIYSGTVTGITGSEIGSIVMFIGTGSYVQTLTYSDDVVTRIGSWS